MFSFIKSLFSSSPKVHARFVIRGFVPQERFHFIQAQVASWGLPGWIRTVLRSHIEIELEGRQSVLQKRLEELRHNPHLTRGCVVEVGWLPYRGRFANFHVRV